MTYPDTFEKKTGFDAVRNEVMRLCQSNGARATADEQLQFTKDYETICHRLRSVDEMTQILGGDTAFPLAATGDVAGLLAKVRPEGTFLGAEELNMVNNALLTSAAISDFFAVAAQEGNTPYPTLTGIAGDIERFDAVSATISRSIDRFGEIKDSASPELAQIRRQLQQTQASISSVMRRVISRAVESGYLEADASAVVRDGRLVLPVSPMHKRHINGIVHDESASGKTYFIEPAEMVEANNRIRELQMDERREMTRILKEITAAIRPDIGRMTATMRVVAEIDFIHAKALYARRVDAHMPHLNTAPELEWYHAVHPVLLLSLESHGKKIVPLDITLSQKDRLLIISGPNAGGKSVCLKTVGIVQYMMQCGMLPTLYENSHMGIFESIFIDIGDDQSIEDDLSTYSSHLRNMKYFLQHGNRATLALIDEFGGGTEPTIGGAIAQAILKDFNGKEMWGVITTHYQNLKNFAEDTPGLINGSMLYDRHLMQPLFKLHIGNPGSSFAIEIARKTGLPAQIIADAEEIAGSDYVRLDRYLLDIARDKRYWEHKRDAIKLKEKKIDTLINNYEAEASTLRDKRREIIAEARSEAQRILDSSNATIERTIREIKNAQAERERTRAARLQMERDKSSLLNEKENDDPEILNRHRNKKKKVKTETPVPAKAEEPLKPGDNVKLDGQTTVGTVMEISGKRAIVNFGALKTTVELSRLRRTIAKPQSGARDASFVSSATTDAMRQRQLSFTNEIDVRGMRVDEALQAITYFLDDAIQFSAGRVRILHGTGTGALRMAIRQMLDSVPGVASYRDEHVQFGGAGITVVDLR